MLRPNLLNAVALLFITLATVGSANAQNYGPGHGIYQQQPMFHMPRSEYQAPIVDHHVQGRPQLWDDQQPVEWFLGEVAKRSWIRAEYIHWRTNGPGSGTAGAPLTGITARNGQFTASDNLNGGISTGIAELLDDSLLQLRDGSGARATWGVDLNGAQMEWNLFGTEDVRDSLVRDPIRNFRPGALGVGNSFSPNVALPLLNGGAVSDVNGNPNLLIFDDSVNAAASSQIWGSEMSFLTNPYVPGEGAHWQWLGGFRYTNVDEGYSIRGVYDNGGALADRVTTINSTTENHVYGPEVGARASIVHRWFTLSATPRVAFALNDHTATVVADPLGLGATTTKMSEIDFCAVTQVSFTGEVHLNSKFSLYGGYDFLWMPQLARAGDTIQYDSTAGGGGFVPNISVLDELSGYLVRGLSVGATFRY
ncbi:MAG: BBP7 family outer membrane beta-barrel protein [Planctomyces sp.]